jgi:hypothetical protein
MRTRSLLGASLAVALLAGSVLAAESLKSGPQVGSDNLPPFNPLNVNGSAKGKKVCQI